MSDYLLAILSFGLVLIPLVIIHELGHFFAAKSVGITVLEFGIGIPPRALTLFSRNGTEYTLNWIPLGGFVRPYGEDFMSPKDAEGMSADLEEVTSRNIENPKSVFEAGPWERMWFMFAGPLFNFIAAFVLLVLMAVLGIPTIVDGDVTLVDIFDGSPAATAGLQQGDIVTHVDGHAVITAGEFDDQIKGKNGAVVLTIVRDGQTQDMVLDTSQEFVVDKDLSRVVIQDIAEDSPAEKAGLLADDIFLRATDGETKLEINTVEELQKFTQDNEGKALDFSIQRGTEIFTKTITPEEIDGVVRIGITISLAEPDASVGALVTTTDVKTEIRPAANLGVAVSDAVDRYWFIIKTTVNAPVDIIKGVIPIEQARPVGPVGISKLGGESLQTSQDEGNPYPILFFAAIISIALGLTNLLPIPALDGGRILFVIIELLRGKPLPPEREGFVHMVGFMFLLSLMLIVVLLDIFKPII